jgi:hypothetical protein
MRIVKMSKDVFGFENKDACKAFFRHVLPWNKSLFTIARDGRFLSKNSFKENEVFLFSFDGCVVSVGKVEKYYYDKNNSNRVYMIRVSKDTLKVLNHELLLSSVEELLFNEGYDKTVVASQGWNIIEKKYENKVLV